MNKLESRTGFDYIEEQLENLRSSPFTLNSLRITAQGYVPSINVRLYDFDSMSYANNTVYIPRKYLSKDPNESRDWLIVLGELLHEIEGHHKLTNSEFLNEIKKKGREENINEEVAGLLFNAIEDVRINNILIEEKTYSYIINHLLKNTWNIQDISQISKKDGDPPLFLQYIYNIVFYWRTTDFIPRSSEQVINALRKNINVLRRAFYTENINRDDYSNDEEYEKARAEESFKAITETDIWEEYKKLYQEDLKSIKQDQSGQMDFNDDDQIPPELQDTYLPTDHESGESGEVAKNGLYEIKPGLRGRDTYCATNKGYVFNTFNLQWDLKSDLTSYTPHQDLNRLSYNYTFTHPGEGKLIPVPLAKGFVINSANTEISGFAIFRSSDGLFSIKANKKTAINLTVSKETDAFDSNDRDVSSMEINISSLTPVTQNFLEKLKADSSAPLSIAKELKKYLLKKGYDTRFQGTLRNSSRSADQYFKKIDEAENIECYTANTFAIALLRKLGIKARLSAGFHPSSTKDKTLIQKSDGHAWAEIWDDSSNKWIIVDFTPHSTGDEDGESGESGESGENSLAEEAEEANKQFEQAETLSPEEVAEIDRDLEQSDISEQKNKSLLESAFKIVDDIANPIIDALTVEYNKNKIRRSIEEELKPKIKTFSGFQSGSSLGNDFESLFNASVIGTNCWNRDISIEDKNEEIDMLDAEFVIAVDCSGSMGSFSNNNTDNFDINSPFDSAFLQVLTLAKISLHFDIPFHVILFSNSCNLVNFDINSNNAESNENLIFEKIANAFIEVSMMGNHANRLAIEKSIELLEISESIKKLILLISDGDTSDIPFFNDEMKSQMTNESIYLAALGYGDATKVTTTFYNRYLTFIESRFHAGPDEAGFAHMKGIPIHGFKDSVDTITNLLNLFISSKTYPELTTDNTSY